MKLAYIILAYKDVEQVSHLIDTLRCDGASFIVHVCKNTKSSYIDRLKEMQKNRSDVFFCKREVGIHYYWGLVKGTLNALEFLYDNKIDFDYVNLISGQDYPIKSNEDLKKFFQENYGKEFMTVFPLQTEELVNNVFSEPHWDVKKQTYRYNRYHIKFKNKVVSIPEIGNEKKYFFDNLSMFIKNSLNYRKQKVWTEKFFIFILTILLPNKRYIPKKNKLYGGSTWWSITKDFAFYIVELNRKDKSLVNFFKYSLIADEMFFQTIIMASPFAKRLTFKNFRKINWDTNNPGHPTILSLKDLTDLKTSECLYARKFDYDTSSLILEALDNNRNK